MAKRLADLCGRGRTAFCMPGTPLGKAMTLEITKVCRVRGIPYAILPGTGYADAALASCGLCFEVPAVSMDAIAAEGVNIDPEKPLVVCEIDSPLLAGAVKLALLEYYPDEWQITLAVPGEKAFNCTRIPLFELDRQKRARFSAGTCVILPPLDFWIWNGGAFPRFRSWSGSFARRTDAPGTRSRRSGPRPAVIEEAYEVVEAIDDEDDAGLCEELGDLLLQVVFLCTLAEEQGGSPCGTRRRTFAQR